MKRIAIIPARGGSKRIPRKNIREFLGKPIIAYSIEAALESELFDEVLVSTDDEEIADVARKYGASVPFLRSKKNADDFAPLSAAIIECLNTVEGDYDIVCCILATAPFISAEWLKRSAEILTECDSVVSICRYSYPIQRALKVDASGNVDFLFPEYKLARSQDLEPCFHDVGQFYWSDVSLMKRDLKLTCGKTKGFELQEIFVQDIDTEEDWFNAEVKCRVLKDIRS
ncbi:pseudaminic acid cytidylyltransferase [Persicobacter sp. CCB-QB2]|uniref:pseudaminic acid cytidylyltransferase n=1 Tax=Persicobacter sp. CCB-QB2 TaxID=1561025 RepID=UPI0006A9CF78|nr:pseudaminic acid cytidylyltransferase [Persicobacter sp. CCB-QB2]